MHRAAAGPEQARAQRITGLGLAVIGVVGAALLVLLGRRALLMSAPACLAGRWHGCVDTFNGTVFLALVSLPVAALTAWGLTRWRRTAGIGSAGRVSMAEVGMVHGTVPFGWLALMPGSGAGTVPGRVSLVPLRDLVTMGPLGIVGNLLVLAALGFFAPIRFSAAGSLPRVLALAAGCSALIETAQFALRLDRVSSVDDVLLNTAGAVAAALASRPWWRTGPRVLSGGQAASRRAAGP